MSGEAVANKEKKGWLIVCQQGKLLCHSWPCKCSRGGCAAHFESRTQSQMFCLPPTQEKLFGTNLARLEIINVLPTNFICPQLERVSSAWVHESEECGEENLWRPQEPDGDVRDRLKIQVCQAGQRSPNLWGPLLPCQGKWCLSNVSSMWVFFREGKYLVLVW